MYSNNPEILEDGTEYYPRSTAARMMNMNSTCISLGIITGKTKINKSLYSLKGSINHAN